MYGGQFLSGNLLTRVHLIYMYINMDIKTLFVDNIIREWLKLAYK